MIQVRLCLPELELFCLQDPVIIQQTSYLFQFNIHHDYPASTIGLCKSDDLNCWFDSTVHYSNNTTLPLVIQCCHLTLSPWDPITLIAFRFPNSMTEVPTTRSGLQRKVIIGFSRMLEIPSEICFSQMWWNVCLQDSPQWINSSYMTNPL